MPGLKRPWKNNGDATALWDDDGKLRVPLPALCPRKNPSAIKTLELCAIVLFCVLWKIGIDIYCAHSG